MGRGAGRSSADRGEKHSSTLDWTSCWSLFIIICIIWVQIIWVQLVPVRSDCTDPESSPASDKQCSAVGHWIKVNNFIRFFPFVLRKFANQLSAWIQLAIQLNLHHHWISPATNQWSRTICSL